MRIIYWLCLWFPENQFSLKSTIPIIFSFYSLIFLFSIAQKHRHFISSSLPIFIIVSIFILSRWKGSIFWIILFVLLSVFCYWRVGWVLLIWYFAQTLELIFLWAIFIAFVSLVNFGFPVPTKSSRSFDSECSTSVFKLPKCNLT